MLQNKGCVGKKYNNTVRVKAVYLNRKVCLRLPGGAGRNGSATGGAEGSVGMGGIGRDKVKAYSS